MGDRLKTFALSVLLAVAASVYIGCATYITSEAAFNGKGHTSKKRVLTDTIIALGKPDEALTEALGNDHCIAFIGKSHTYMLYKGGKALWEISQLKLDPNRIKTDASKSKALFLKGDQVWGKLIVTYDPKKTTSPEQHSELIKAGFASDGKSGGKSYQKSISIRGSILPAIKYSSAQMPKLTKSHTIKFYANEHHEQHAIEKIVKAPLVVVGVAVDVMLLPVYIIAIASLDI